MRFLSANPYTFGIVNVVTTPIPPITNTLGPVTIDPSLSTIAPGSYKYSDGSYTVEWTETYSTLNFKFTTRGSALKNKYSAFTLSNNLVMVNKFHLPLFFSNLYPLLYY